MIAPATQIDEDDGLQLLLTLAIASGLGLLLGLAYRLVWWLVGEPPIVVEHLLAAGVALLGLCVIVGALAGVALTSGQRPMAWRDRDHLECGGMGRHRIGAGR